MSYALLEGDCLEQLKGFPDASVDSLVTDPPAGISFMGKDWDDDKGGRDQWVAWMTEVMAECLRVMKPGAHGLVWALPRTSHWTATALEDAGFEIRDVVTHLFGTGFPKSLNIEKAGAGKEWAGWGTALKPASEHWVLIRKPCSEKTVAANVLKWGCGGINIDAGRVALLPGETTHGSGKSQSDNPNTSFGDMGEKRVGVPNIKSTQGRFPANLVLDEYAAAALDEQSGYLKSGTPGVRRKPHETLSMSGTLNLTGKLETGVGDSGGASRFFYVAKPSKREKNSGCESNFHPTVKSTTLMTYLITMITPPNGLVLDPFTGSGTTGVAALQSGFRFIGCERDPSYYLIAEARISSVAVDAKSTA